MGLASRLADMNRIRFQLVLGSRQISVNYDEAAFEENSQTIDRLKTTRPNVVVSDTITLSNLLTIDHIYYSKNMTSLSCR